MENGTRPRENPATVCATTVASLLENAPRSRRATTMGRANAMKIAEHGTMTKVVNRSPKDSRSRSSPMSPRPAALAISGASVVMRETASSP